MSVELLAPVGSLDSFKAAIQNHADAVYLGGKQFGARAYADNFSNQEIKEMIQYAHFFDAKVYVTINTIIYDDEFEQLIEFLDFLYQNECDAIIIQDLGVANLVKQRYPDFEIHASTQMNIHSIEQVKVLKELGFKRVVLARELSLEEIIEIKNNVDIEIEVFVHGALCVSHSGNCYFSSVVGKRSGNRGRCAQPCRLQYSLNDKSGYLISPKDLNTIDYIDRLIEARIDSLKIEGRMKRPEYVAQIVKSYKEAINNYFHHTNFDLEKNQKDLKTIFNRQFTKGFIFKEENKEFVNKEFSNHIGIEVGQVVYSGQDWVQIKLTDMIRKGDSIRITGEDTDAITINQIYIGKNVVEEATSGQIVRLKAHKNNLMGGVVFLTTSINQINELENTYKKENRKIEITGKCSIENNFLTLTISDGVNYVKEVSETKVEDAININSNERLIDQIKKTSSTNFIFKELFLDFEKPIFLSIKDTNELRRRALDRLKEKRIIKYPNRTNSEFNYISYHKMNQDFKVKVKVRNEEQLKAVVNFNVSDIYVTDIKLLKYNEQFPNIRFSYVLPRINKKHQEIDERFGIVSSDISILNGVITSIYMNTTNCYAINLLEKYNVKTIGLSLELSYEQIKNLFKNYQRLFNSKPNLEVMVYGRYELMLMKYCVVNMAVGCSGCKHGDLSLTDRKGFNFPLLKENDCSMKILNSKKLHLKDYIGDLKACGVNNVLLDFTIESYQEVMEVCDIYFKNSNKQIDDVTYGHFKEGVL